MVAREGIHIGYPRAVPFYSPPRLGDSWETPPEGFINEDFELAELLATKVAQLKQVRPRQAFAITVFWGAYIGAPFERSERYRSNGISGNNCRKLAKRGQQWIQNTLR